MKKMMLSTAHIAASLTVLVTVTSYFKLSGAFSTTSLKLHLDNYEKYRGLTSLWNDNEVLLAANKNDHSSTKLNLSSPSRDPGFVLGPNAGGAKQRKKKLKQFSRYIEIECWKRQELRELESVLCSISEACKQINRIVQRAQTDDLYGNAVDEDGIQLDENIQGEVQQKLDVVCNTIMLRTFCGSSTSIAAVASEEEDCPRTCCDVMVRKFLPSRYILTTKLM